MTFDSMRGPARVSPQPLPVVQAPEEGDGFYDERQIRVDLRPLQADIVQLPLSQHDAARFAIARLRSLGQTMARAGLDQWAGWMDAAATCLDYDFPLPEVPA